MLRDTFGAEGTPLLMGPCPGMSWPQLATWFPAFLSGTAGALDVAVYHSYNQIHADPPRVLYLNETVPSGNASTQHGEGAGGTGWQAKAMAGFAAVAGVPLWLGEFGPHNGGGGGTYASTFVSSFGYLDTLGTLARLGHAATARQTLVGGNYELLRCSSGQAAGPEPGAGCDFEPHPDYWVALLWKRLMSPRVLAAPRLTFFNGSGAALRVHAHCTAASANGSVTLAFSNMDEDATYSLSIERLLGGDGQARAEYLLTAANETEGMGARRVALNGAPLATQGTDVVPPLPPRWADAADTLSVPPVSIGWVVLPDAKASVCVRAPTDRRKFGFP